MGVYTRVRVLLVFIILLLTASLIGAFVIINFNMRRESISVKLLEERIHGSIVNRYLSINGMNVTVSGYTYNLNHTWKNIRNETVSFSAIWVQQLYYRAYSLLPVRNDVVTAIYNETGENLIFASNYNGSHFSEAIIVGHAFDMRPGKGIVFVIYENGTYIGLTDTGIFVVLHEYNRSTIYVNSTDSIYNPSYAIFRAVNFLNEQNATFDNLTDIYLIPKRYLTAEFNGYDFVWTFKFYRDISNETTPMRRLYYFIVAPSGTILEFENITLIGCRVTVPVCGGCTSPPSNQSKQLAIPLFGCFCWHLGGRICLNYVDNICKTPQEKKTNFIIR